MNSFIVFALVLAAANAAYEGAYHEYYDHPNYNFEYKVHDEHTGDIKSQHESRHGDVVKGFYTLKEADGTTREVHYTADDHHGFNADVKKIGHVIYHPTYGHHY